MRIPLLSWLLGICRQAHGAVDWQGMQGCYDNIDAYSLKLVPCRLLCIDQHLLRAFDGETLGL